MLLVSLTQGRSRGWELVVRIRERGLKALEQNKMGVDVRRRGVQMCSQIYMLQLLKPAGVMMKTVI